MPSHRLERGDLSFECLTTAPDGSTCPFYADGPNAPAKCRAHAKETGHPLSEIVGTACFFFRPL